MISRDSVQTLIGGTAYTNDGDKIGSIGQVYLDNASGEPAWVTVKTGLFGSSESFVPLDQAELTDDGVRVPYDKDRVKGAPNIESDRELSEQEEDQLYSYYGVSGHTSDTTSQSDSDRGWGAGETGYQSATTGTGTGTTEGYADTRTQGAEGYADRGAEGHDTSGPTTDDAMTRSEERVRTGTEQVQAGKARLRKYVTTEQQQVTVPVTHEEVRVEREPITDANRGQAMSGPDLSEEEHEVVLNEERPVVATEAVPVERVRLAKDQVQDEQTVNVDVRKEEIDSQTDAGTTGGEGLRDR